MISKPQKLTTGSKIKIKGRKFYDDFYMVMYIAFRKY